MVCIYKSAPVYPLNIVWYKCFGVPGVFPLRVSASSIPGSFLAPFFFILSITFCFSAVG